MFYEYGPWSGWGCVTHVSFPWLQEKLERLYQLDRVMQEQSFQVTSLKEDRVSITLPLNLHATICDAPWDFWSNIDDLVFRENDAERWCY